MEVFEVREPLLFIFIGPSLDEGRVGGDVYEAVRWAWKINVQRARRYKLVLARDRTEVLGAYRPEEWLAATPDNFPGMKTVEHGRWGFIGKRAEPEVWDYYVGKQVPDIYIGNRSPFRYCHPD